MFGLGMPSGISYGSGLFGRAERYSDETVDRLRCPYGPRWLANPMSSNIVGIWARDHLKNR